MKLVVSSNGDLELPAAETCALDNEDDDEQCDRVHFKQKGKFFTKLKNLATNRKVCGRGMVGVASGWSQIKRAESGEKGGAKYTILLANSSYFTAITTSIF